jgi:ATP-dependent Lhr-like helicase
MWGQLYERLVALSAQHRTMFVFTNTRRLAERVAHDLGERLGPGAVARAPRLHVARAAATRPKTGSRRAR